MTEVGFLLAHQVATLGTLRFSNQRFPNPTPLSVDSWTILDRTHESDFRIFDVHRQRMRSPQSGREHDYFVLDAPDWVHVVPLTDDGQVVCVRQYRAGTDAVTLEIPGGVVDPEDESPIAAARREMREETGYTADAFTSIGHVDPNPAIQNNRCHTVRADGARLAGAQALDGSEEIDVELADLDAIPSPIATGRITHSLVVAAFYLLNVTD